MNDTRHIIFVVADSLRYDSVWSNGDAQLPTLQSKSTTFNHVYSSGCWTLPSHASMFTGLLPHQHGATTRSRGLQDSLQTVAEHMREQGYQTIQLTANPVTTHIFGLDRGFDRTERVWQQANLKNVPFANLFVLAGKRRIRDKFLRGDFITGKMTEDIQAGQAWVRALGPMQFDRAKQILEEAEKAGQKVFLFINLMETHFPYHVGLQFHILSRGILDKLREIKSLFHLVNQSWLKRDKEYIRPKMLSVLRRRQKLAWRWFS
ncbi:MAG TPA: sulfatase-like hydrolase/transferase, partial [bacterium]|nr:sulfatase-like hydrolase/transferase [bacterium]